MLIEYMGGEIFFFEFRLKFFLVLFFVVFIYVLVYLCIDVGSNDVDFVFDVFKSSFVFFYIFCRMLIIDV